MISLKIQYFMMLQLLIKVLQSWGQVFIKDDKYNIDLKMKSDLLSKIFINGRAIKNEKFDISEIYSK